MTDRITLTQDDKKAIRGVTQGYNTWFRQRLYRVLESIVAARAAEIWDEGAGAGGNCGCEHDAFCSFQTAVNPYGNSE